MKVRFCVMLSLAGSLALAQQGPQIDNPLSTNPVTLASQFFEHNNYFNYYAFTNGVYDSYAPTYNSLGQLENHGGFGYTVGGGLSAYHAFRKATFSINYSGDYRDYTTPLFSSGTDQNLGLSYSRRLSRRWNMSISQGAGIVLYGTGYVGSQEVEGSNVALNPFSASTRYASTNLSFSYRQTRRLSYVVSGNFFLQRYSYINAVGVTGGSGSGSVVYRLTPRTTVSGNYAFTAATYQRNSGDSRFNSLEGSISHQFPNHWFVTFSGGVTHTNVSGFISIPISSLPGEIGAGGYVYGLYSNSSNFPSFSGSVTRVYRRFQLSGSAGQSVSTGNGYYLASRNQFFNGVFSRTLRRSNFSVGANWYRLRSASNDITYAYSAGGVGASYGYQLMRYVSSNFRYDYVRYGNLTPYPAIADNRLSFGFSFSSRSVPLTLY